MGSWTSTDASLEEEDMGLSVVRLSSWPLKDERASGDDSVGERESAGWVSMGEGEMSCGDVEDDKADT